MGTRPAADPALSPSEGVDSHQPRNTHLGVRDTKFQVPLRLGGREVSAMGKGRAMYEQTRRMGAVIPWLTRLGVIRLTNLYPAHPDLPPKQRAQIEAFNSSTQHWVTTVEEFSATPDTNAQVRSMGSLGDKPLAVITAGQQSAGWPEMQEELAALSSNSVHRVVEGATHESLLYDKGDSQVSSAAIQQVVEASRTDRPLNR